uniref:EGF-like domain-containing protein n=1 Tax=Schistocephalus solidus TaxID=70667 RepID=A0A183TFV5_SCHSO
LFCASFSVIYAPCSTCGANAYCLQSIASSTCACNTFYEDSLNTPNGMQCRLSGATITLICIGAVVAAWTLVLVIGFLVKGLSNHRRETAPNDPSKI